MNTVTTFNAIFSALDVDPHRASEVTRRCVHVAALNYADALGWKPPPPTAVKAETPRRPASGSLPTTLPGYGRAQGQPIATATKDDCRFYEKGCLRTLDDPSKERWHAKEQAMLEALRARLRELGEAGDWE